MRSLILGYGNADRQDDGVAWHVLNDVIAALGSTAPQDLEDEDPVSLGNYDFRFVPQLTPELSDTLATYGRVCFVDAHTGAVPEDIHFENLLPGYRQSPFTHHLTPNSLLAMTDSIYHKSPSAILVSLRGYEFGFSPDLSKLTGVLIPQAVELILKWLNS